MRRLNLLVAAAAAAAATGCGGSNSLSGGSIPPGTASIRAVVVLPNSQPLVNASVSIVALATGQTVNAYAALGAGGAVTASGLPTDRDLEIILQGPGATLKAVVPRATLASAASQPVDVGMINAQTTVVAESLQLAATGNETQTEQLVATQASLLAQSYQNDSLSAAQQEQIIADPSSLQQTASGLVQGTASAELQNLGMNDSPATAATALEALLAEVRAIGGAPISLTSTQRSSLVNRETAHESYVAAQIAGALDAVGVHATAADVDTADQIERQRLPGIAALGPGISPFEAFAIATSPKAAGGFGLNQTTVSAFLNALP